MPKSPTLIKQHDITDCGAACLASVVRANKIGLQPKGIKSNKGIAFQSAKGCVGFN